MCLKTTLYPHSEFIYSVWLLQPTVVISLNSLKKFFFKMEEGHVLYEVRNGHSLFFCISPQCDQVKTLSQDEISVNVSTIFVILKMFPYHTPGDAFVARVWLSGRGISMKCKSPPLRVFLSLAEKLKKKISQVLVNCRMTNFVKILQAVLKFMHEDKQAH